MRTSIHRKSHPILRWASLAVAAFVVANSALAQDNDDCLMCHEDQDLVGEVDGKNCLLADDMVDTGGTLANAVHALKERGAKQVYACATHALLSGKAMERLSSAPLEEFVVTNTIHVPEDRRWDRLTILSVAGLLANAVEYIHSNESVSQLFEFRDND